MGKTILDTVKAELIALGIEIDLLFQFPYDKENPQLAILKDFLEQTEKLKTDITNIIKKSSQHDIFTKEGGEDLHNQIKAHYNSLLTFKAETQNVLSRLTPNSSTSDGTQQLNPTSSANQINIQLPKLNLPKFSGQYEQWKSFSDLFIATIDKNPSLTNAQKLSYLKGSLTGDAALMIQAYTITDENYRLCFQLLKTHYDRNREIIFSFIDRLLNLNAISHVSKESLSQFSISVSDITHNLQTLGIDLKACNSFITRIIMKKVDSYSLESWLHLQTVDEVPDFNSLLKHLDVRSMALETQAKATTSSNRTNPQSSSCVKNKQVKTYTITTSNNSCPICQKQPSHRFIECEKFKSMTPIERHKKIRSLKRCFLCFSSTHLSSQCSYKPCFLCKEAHHRMLHNQPTENLTPNPNAPNPNPIANCSNSTGKILVSCHVSGAVNVTVPILSTACLNLLCADGSVRPARFLIDSASEVSLISSQISNSLKTKIRPNPIQISGLGSTSKIDITHSTLVYLSSRFREAEFLPFEFYIVNSLQLSLPTKPVDISSLSYMGDKPLADPNFHIPGPIDGILGASACAQILTGEKFPDPNGDTALFNSKFGWLLLGSAPVKTRNVLQISDTTANPNLCSKYWELEESLNLPVPECLSVEETSFRTHTQLINHRIQVRLPLRPDHVPLGNSESKAVTLLYALERKFVRNPSYHLKYVDSMNSYLNNEHLEPVPPLELFRNDNRCFYLPHSAVPKKNSSTLRIVFNGSSTSSNGKSLNDILLTGDVLQTDIRHVLTNFRSHRFVLCMDIISMFLQILVEKNDRDLLRVLWREDSSQPISVYRFTRVPFGLSCSPFLAIRAIHYLADQFSTQYPKAAQCIKNNSYVDDFLLGADTIPELKTLVQEICLILEQGSFQFDKFSSNSVDLLEELKSQHIILDSSKVLSPGDSTVLGIDWRSQDDIFYFQLTIPNQTPNTKRGILSELQRVYDPLGFLNPCLIKFKILFQELWKDKTLDWDTPIPQTFQTSWQVYHEEVQHFKFIKIPRHLKPPDSSHYKLFGFCDASGLSYAFVLYIAFYTHDTFLDSSRRLVRSVIFKCVVCAKNRFNPMTQKMANLPPERVRVSKPFHITGTDYFGPLQIYYKRRRGVRPHKAYGLIFICFTTHAIHLELVADLTTNSFLLALQRFVSRRGTPAEIHCDNSTTFVGAKGLLRKEWDSIRNHPESPEVRNYSNKQLITWKHIPPYSPSFGALWESNIKSIKYLLKRSLGTSLLTYDEAVTALAKIEALLNSRPLSPLSNDPNSFEALTPGHFLIGSSLTTLPIKNEPSPPLSINKRWKYVSTLATSFWNRWNQEHLTHLQQRLRWLHTKEEPRVGQLVLLMEKSCLPGKWTMARIVEVIPGRDKHSRIVKLRTPTGECLRSISKISPLPIKFEG